MTPAAVKTEATANVQQQPTPAPATKNPPPPPVAKNEDAAPARADRASPRSVDSNREASRKRTDDRKTADDRRYSPDDRRYSERRRRQDQGERRQDSDETVGVVRQTRRDNTVGRDTTVREVVEQDEAPRFGGGRPRHLELLEDDDSPRVANDPPPRLGFFGFGN
jgi:hypothetical protein